MSLSPYTLWSDTARTRFFLIPDDEQLPPGEFDLRTITGRHLKVDAATLAQFEISEQEAKEWLKGEFGKMLEGARAAADRFIEKLRQGPPDVTEDEKPAGDK
jgi:hypothetical protein